MVDNTNIMDNIANYSVKQYGARNTSSPFSSLCTGNVGTLGDTLSTSIADESDGAETIKWATKRIDYIPGSSAYAPYYTLEGVKFTRKSTERYCLVQFRFYNTHISSPYSTPPDIGKGDVVYAYVLLTYDASISGFQYYGFSCPITGIRESTTEITNQIRNYGLDGTTATSLISIPFNDLYAQVRTNDKYLLETRTYFEALNNMLIGNKDNLKAYRGTSFHVFDGYYNYTLNNFSNVRMMSLLKCAADIPVFDISNYTAIANYLLNGEIEETLSPSSWSEETQETEAGFKIPDYTTTWDIYLTAGDGNGRAVITALCPMAEELGAEPRKKVKTVYSVDPKTSYLFDSKYTYQEKQYGNAFGVNLSDIARNEGGSAWLDSNNDPKGNHKLYGMLYTGGGNSIAFSFEWFFEPTSNIGVEIVSGNAVKFWKAAVSPVGSFVIQSTSVEQTAWGWKYTDLYGDVVNLHINESYTEENDVYNPDRGNQYNPLIDTYGGGSSTALPSASAVGYGSIYRLSPGELKFILNEFTSVSWTSAKAALFGTDAWSCFKSLKYIPFEFSVGQVSGPFTVGGIQVGNRENYKMVGPVGHITLPTHIMRVARKYNNFIDYEPYTKLYLHLPFVGYVSLPVDEVYNADLTFELFIDVVNGEGVWQIFRNKCIKWTFQCNCAANTPLSGSNYGTIFRNAFLNSVSMSGIASLSLGTAANAIEKSIRNDAQSGYLNMTDSMSIFYILEYPKAQLPTSSPHDNGRPCGLTKTLSSLKGFTKCKNVDVSGYSCTDAERNELISLLESGIYL